MTVAAPTVQEVIQRYEAYGGALELMSARDLEVCLDGPAGTGKTLAIWFKLHFALQKYAGARALALRKEASTLVATALVTYRKQVLHPLCGVKFFGGSKDKPPAFLYPNGSELLLGGLDRPDKVMSAEYDMIYVNEATDLSVDEWELPLSRLRNGVMPYQQLIADVNPRYPKHWLNKRMNPPGEAFNPAEHRTRRIISRHQDNPKYYDRQAGEWTAAGKAYIEGVLGALTGVRRLRLLNGIWAAAEGSVYGEVWDERVHILPRSAICTNTESQYCGSKYGDCGIPRNWPRYMAIDYGYTHPYVCQFWAKDSDGRLFRYREIYMTKRLVKDHVETMRKYAKWGDKDGDPLPRTILHDPSAAEAKNQLKAALGMYVTDADNDIRLGIQATTDMLRTAGDGKPRMLFLENSLVERDTSLIDEKKPASTEEEIDGYVWPTLQSKKQDELPIDKDNHGMDSMRYMAKHEAPRPTSKATKIKMF